MIDYEEEYLKERIRVNEHLYQRLLAEGFAYSKVASSVASRIKRWKERLREIRHEKRNKTTSL